MQPDYSFKYDISKHMGKGTRIIGCIEGDAQPADFIPQLIEYYRQGKLPLDVMGKFYKVRLLLVVLAIVRWSSSDFL